GTMVYNEELEKEIPEGWEVNSLNEVFDIRIGRTPPRNEQEWFTKNGKGMKWVSIKDLGENGTFILSTNEELTEHAIKNFKVPIVPSNTVILSFKMSIGIVSITTEKMLTNEAIAHFNIKNKNIISSEYIYCFLSQFHFDSLGTTSSIVTSINTRIIKEINILLPSKDMVNFFTKRINPIFQNILLIEQKNKNLITLQSLLLSRMATVVD